MTTTIAPNTILTAQGRVNSRQATHDRHFKKSGPNSHLCIGARLQLKLAIEALTLAQNAEVRAMNHE